MKTQLVAICLGLLQLAPQALARPGFFNINDPMVPLKIKAASKSVFKIRSQAGPVDINIDIRNTYALEKAKARIGTAEDSWWQIEQLNFCKKENIPFCSVFSHMGDGTAFIAGDSQTVYTNFHNFNGSISAQVKNAKADTARKIYETVKQLPLFMILGDQFENNIFIPTTNTAKLNFVNPNPALFDGTHASTVTLLGTLSDVVEFKLQYPLNAQALKIADEKPDSGEAVYLLGFPRKTTDRQALGVTDSDGKSLLVTLGKTMDVKEWAQRSGKPLKPVSEGLFRKHMIFADFDCEVGNSGGPILNSKGEVVGILAGVAWDLTNSPRKRICCGLRTLDKEVLTSLWKALAP